MNMRFNISGDRKKGAFCRCHRYRLRRIRYVVIYTHTSAKAAGVRTHRSIEWKKQTIQVGDQNNNNKII